jgi:hypothetical protein
MHHEVRRFHQMNQDAFHPKCTTNGVGTRHHWLRDWNFFPPSVRGEPGPSKLAGLLRGGESDTEFKLLCAPAISVGESNNQCAHNVNHHPRVAEVEISVGLVCFPVVAHRRDPINRLCDGLRKWRVVATQ